MDYLIDGYNLAHQITLPAGKVTSSQLHAARDELLRLIGRAHGPTAARVTVVFDTRRSRQIEPTQFIYGITVHFSIGEQADDMIERLIKEHPAPKKLTIVSDDHRVQQAGRRRGCRITGCSEYLDHLERRPTDPVPEPGNEKKPEPGTPGEWLAAFLPDHPNRPTGR